jgi:hypothetical protein
MYLSGKTGKVKWDVARLADRVKNAHLYADGNTTAEDARLAKYFENPQLGNLNEPATILDCHGHIMVWYLPYIFSMYRVVRVSISLIQSMNRPSSMYLQTDLNGGTKILRPQLDSVMQSFSTANCSSWRHSEFDPPPDGGEFGAGVLNMSPGWFQRLQDVSLLPAVANRHWLTYLLEATGQRTLCFFWYKK